VTSLAGARGSSRSPPRSPSRSPPRSPPRSPSRGSSRRALDALGWLCAGSAVYLASARLLRLPEVAALLRERRPRT
ncbi:MAG: hypothetical protein LC135_12040, partial [Phycisphaerae bacterium]|nr:hypothetical protein [Phycisphaerae bacterium]